VVDFDDVLTFVSGSRYDTGEKAMWSEGDSDYNGVVDFDDVLTFVSAGLFDAGPYNAGTPLGGLALLGKGGETDAKLLGGGIVAVPEPSGMILLVALAGSMALLRRRNRI